ncbi:hypothetical protein [Tenacibaculum larymnensis]|uniref:Uncharacterized protein n=1 Tax=Tenacibaculum larymnensis TaxID=2878201 RepID=A0A9X4EQ40_9FLAO|nr:hypothetical protein [Tenacibaculum larymnensis]MDE1206175.1 hypothetical protein [Tenacibaculum larymnensis]
MKTLELNQMEVIQGAGFWEGFCGSTSIVGGAAGIAAYAGLITITGGAAAVGLGVIGIGCGIAAFT